jgi:hypothetical protein
METPGKGKTRALLEGFLDLDRLLRGELTRAESLQRGSVEVAPGRLSLVLVILCMVYGACMGAFAVFGPRGGHAMQVVASMLKVPALFFLTLLATLPSLYVFNALVGSRLTLPAVIRLLGAALGVNVAVLVSLGPIVAFFSVSTTSYPFMVLFDVLAFAVSGVLGQLFLLQVLQRLSLAQSQPDTIVDRPEPAEPDPDSPGALTPLDRQVPSRHVRSVFRLWLVVFALVGSQMGWILRPFVGNPGVPVQFFREDSFTNAYVAVVEMIWRVVTSP